LRRDVHLTWTLAWLLLASCGERDAPARAVLGYRWNGGGGVPNHGLPLALPPPFGALGRTPATRLYLGFDHALESELALEGQALELGASSGVLGAQDGRIGGALELGAADELRLRRRPSWDGHGPWTLELWFRPRAGAAGRLVHVPGRLELALDEKRRLRLSCPRLEPPVALELAFADDADRWHHLGLVVDPLDTRSVRMELDGRVRATKVRPDLAALTLDELVLGDGEGHGLASLVDELRVQARAANTAEFVEHAAGPPAGAQRLHLIHAGGPASETEELEVWLDPLPLVPLGPNDWARGELEHVVAGPAGLRWVPGDWRCEPALDPPLARTTHPSVPIGAGRVLVFGGEVRDSHGGPWVNGNDTWLFDTRAARWTRLVTPLAPSPRCHQPIAWSPDHGLALLFGGWWNEGGDRQFDDTWVFHADELRWEERHPAGAPAVLSDHGLVYHPRARRFVLYQTGRIWTYDPEADRWERLPEPSCVDASGAPASYALGAASMAIDPGSGLVLLFGGTETAGGHARFFDTTALYELESNRLTVLAPERAPSPRVRAGLAWDPRHARFVLFGGVQDERSQRQRDLWSFTPATRVWTEHESAHTPSERGGYFGMAFDPEQERFFLLCGRQALDRLLAEAWSLSLDERAAGRARYVFARGEASGGRWFAETNTPGDSSVAFRFRASADGLRWSEWAATSEALEPRAFLEVEATLRAGTRGEAPEIRALGFR
jgi:concanavalin A-like lectin/glucanase superfamily protein/galactose oxidase-like protein